MRQLAEDILLCLCWIETIEDRNKDMLQIMQSNYHHNRLLTPRLKCDEIININNSFYKLTSSQCCPFSFN